MSDTYSIVTTKADHTRLERAAAYADEHKALVPRVADLKWEMMHGETERQRKQAYEQLTKAYFTIKRRK